MQMNIPVKIWNSISVPWFYEIMNGKEGGALAVNNPMSGIVDPRIPYYWFNQVTAEEASGVSNKEYSDGAFIFNIIWWYWYFSCYR